MGTKIENCEINVGYGCLATVEVTADCYITITFMHNDRSPVEIPRNPELLKKALSELKNKFHDFDLSLIYPAKNWVTYRFKRIL